MLLVASLLSVFSAVAQKADWEKVVVSYIRLPLKPTAPMAKTYSMQINMDTEGLASSKVKSRKELVSSITNTNELLVKQGHEPQPVPTDYEYYSVERSADVLRKNFAIDGCKEVTAAPEFSIILNVSGFNITDTKLYSYMQTNSTGAAKVYGYEVSYVYKVAYQVYDASGTLLREDILAETDKPKKKKTKTFATELELQSWWGYTDEAKTTFKAVCDNEAYNKAISDSKAQLNSEFGYTTKTEKFDVATAKDVKVYPDLATAFTQSVMAYNYLAVDKSKAKEYLLKAVGIWEKALTESNMSDKKARINEHITIALHINLATAYCFLENWEQCDYTLIKLKTMDVSGGLKSKLEDTEIFKKDYEMRAKANGLQ